MLKYQYQSPLGPITLLANDQHLLGLWFAGQKYYGAGYDLDQAKLGQNKAIQLACQWLDDYFAGKNPDPRQVPLAPSTTAFRNQVYQALRQVPYGHTTTYKLLSDAMQKNQRHKKNYARAIGSAVGHNPILLLIPCHRVLGSDGSLTGYAGGLARKQALLNLEKSDRDEA